MRKWSSSGPREPAFDEGPGIDARGGVALEEDLVARGAVGLAPEEVVEPDLVQRGRGGEGGQVAADALGRWLARTTMTAAFQRM